MKPRCLAASLLLLCAWPAVPQPQPLHLFVSNGVRAVIEGLQPDAEKAAGRSFTMVFDTTSALKHKIEAGEPFDAAIFTSDAIADLVKEGKLTAESRTEIARCGIGMGVRAGAPKPDIHTPDALKMALRKAKSITYARDGASRKFIEKMFDDFGIAAEVKPKTLLPPGSVEANELVKTGKAEMVLTLVSEIIPARGVALVGPLPKDVQNYVNFAAGASANAGNGEAATKLIQFLKSPAAAPVYRAKGLEAR